MWILIFLTLILFVSLMVLFINFVVFKIKESKRLKVLQEDNSISHPINNGFIVNTPPLPLKINRSGQIYVSCQYLTSYGKISSVIITIFCLGEQRTMKVVFDGNSFLEKESQHSWDIPKCYINNLETIINKKSFLKINSCSFYFTYDEYKSILEKKVQNISITNILGYVFKLSPKRFRKVLLTSLSMLDMEIKYHQIPVYEQKNPSLNLANCQSEQKDDFEISKMDVPYSEMLLSDLVSHEDYVEIVRSESLNYSINNTTIPYREFGEEEVLAELIIDNGKKFKLLAPFKGYYSLLFNYSELTPGLVHCTYYSSIQEISQHGGRIDYCMQKDPFDHSMQLKWNGMFSYASDGYYMHDIILKLGVLQNKPSISFLLTSKESRLHKGDRINLLFKTNREDRILTFELKEDPHRNKDGYSIEFPLYKDQIYTMLNFDFLILRLEHMNKDASLDIYNRRNFGRYFTLQEDNSKDYSTYNFRCYVYLYLQILNEYHIEITDIIVADNIDTITTEEKCYVYLMVDTVNGFHKIGISNHPKYREHTLQSEKPSIELVACKQYPTRKLCESIEASLHKTYGDKRIRGEWFNLTENDVAELKEMLK